MAVFVATAIVVCLLALAVILIPRLAFGADDAGSDEWSKYADDGVVWMYLASFGFGVLTSLTPCVYPMIPIIVGIFGARDEAVTRRKAFGLARTYQASQLSGLTMVGESGGTPLYMPPEQVRNFREVKPPADQYAAAATLYFLVCGQPIYDPTREMTSAMLRVLQDDPVPLRQRDPDVPAGLSAVIHRALAREPGDRYPTAAALAADLRRFLEDRPIEARRPAPWRLAAQWARRHRAAVWSAGLAAAAVLVVAVVALAVSNWRIGQEQGTRSTTDVLLALQTQGQLRQLAVLAQLEAWLAWIDGLVAQGRFDDAALSALNHHLE